MEKFSFLKNIYSHNYNMGVIKQSDLSPIELSQLEIDDIFLNNQRSTGQRINFGKVESFNTVWDRLTIQNNKPEELIVQYLHEGPVLFGMITTYGQKTVLDTLKVKAKRDGIDKIESRLVAEFIRDRSGENRIEKLLAIVKIR